jgi:fructose-1-phosphate kinase PfkB-like protein
LYVIVRLTKAANGNGSVPEELPPAIYHSWINTLQEN